MFCLQPPVQPIHSSATATCALTTPSCAMGFRTVSTHGMRITAKVIIFILPSILRGSPGRLLWLIRVYFKAFQSWYFTPTPPYCSYSLLFSPQPFLPPEKRSKGLFHQITKTHGTVIGVSSGIVLVLLIISILVQMKQPRKKVTHPLRLTFCSMESTDPEA